MKRPGLALVVEWAGTLGAAGLWTTTAVWREYPNVSAILVFPSRAHLVAGLGLIALGLIARRYRTGHFFRRTPFDLPILLFLLGAVVGWLCAYNRELGLLKLHFLLGAVAVFYLLADAGPAAAKRFALGFIFVAAGLATLLTAQRASAAGSLYLDGIGPLPELFAPLYELELPNSNTIAGILELALLFNLWWFYTSLRAATRQAGGALPTSDESDLDDGRSARLARVLPLAASLIALSCIISGLLLTGSRGAWVALAGAAGLGLVRSGSWRLGRRLLHNARVAWMMGVAAVVLAALTGLGLYGAGLTRPTWLNSVPGGSSASQYADVFQNAFYQAQDYFFTGVGPRAFQMVYSTYSLLIHVGFIPDAHHLYLQVWLEQGLLGVGALLWMAGVALWLMASGGRARPWHARAAGWGIVVMLLHGLTDAPLYAYESWSVLFLFVPFGLFAPDQTASALECSSTLSRPPEAGKHKILRIMRWSFVGMILGAAVLWHREVVSLVLSNLGAVEQTQIVLGQYSWPEWPVQDEVRRQADLSRPVRTFQQALAWNPHNATANRRLGMIALAEGEYPAALACLEAAYASTPGDNATRQLLGEAYIVNGQVDEGVVLWAGVNNDQGQLDIRAWWYRHVGDVERAAWVEEAVRRVSP